MIRQIQKSGVRFWNGSDLLSIQAEGFKVLDGFLSQFGDLVITGVVPQPDGSITPGLVSLGGTVMPFAGVEQTAFPAYLVPHKKTLEREYFDGTARTVAEVYTAQLMTVRPTAANYIEITEHGAPCFPVGDMVSVHWSPASYDDFSAPKPDPGQQGVDTLGLEQQVLELQQPEVEVPEVDPSVGQ